MITLKEKPHKIGFLEVSERYGILKRKGGDVHLMKKTWFIVTCVC